MPIWCSYCKNEMAECTCGCYSCKRKSARIADLEEALRDIKQTTATGADKASRLSTIEFCYAKASAALEKGGEK